jgi:hypothetical protein
MVIRPKSNFGIGDVPLYQPQYAGCMRNVTNVFHLPAIAEQNMI